MWQLSGSPERIRFLCLRHLLAEGEKQQRENVPNKDGRGEAGYWWRWMRCVERKGCNGSFVYSPQLEPADSLNRCHSDWVVDLLITTPRNVSKCQLDRHRGAEWQSDISNLLNSLHFAVRITSMACRKFLSRWFTCIIHLAKNWYICTSLLDVLCTLSVEFGSV